MTEPTPSRHKVKSHHLERDAYLYIRQSSMRQVLENTESTKRQYDLRERALALGWQSEQVRIIDCDQGRSGATEAGRDGFQQLVAEVSLSKAGIVMGLEVSRLARNNADWHRLLQLCAFTDSLILDQDGLYDPASFNDRLLLGLKGAMSEAELHVLKTRLQEGILSKAKRGELKMPLPVGLVYDELDRVVLTPDRQVQDVLQRLFAAFRRLQSASAVLREFRRDGIDVPHYSRTGPKGSRVIWGDLTHSQTLRILHNPRYAGAFAYGRARTRRGPDGCVRYRKQPRDQWISLIRDAHAGYIDWDEYERNQKALARNLQAFNKDRRTPPREGPALLQGIVICGICGKRMSVGYHQYATLVPEYKCVRDMIEQGRPERCQHMPGAAIDTAVSDLLISMLNSKSVDIAVAVRAELQSRLQDADRLRLQQVERCRYEADLARRRYLKVDPDKRFVAEVLEAEWNEKLRQLDAAQTEYEQARQRDQLTLDHPQLEALSQLPDDFQAIWQTDRLTNRDRKRIVRLLVEDVTLIRRESITVHIRLKGGACKTLSLPRPRRVGELRKTSGDVVDTIGSLLEDHPDYRIAEILNAEGMRSATGKAFSQHVVTRVRMAYDLPSRQSRLQAQGKLTAKQLAAKFGVGPEKIRRCRQAGLLTAHEYKEGHYLYDAPGANAVAEIPQLKPHAHVKQRHTTDEVQYAT